MKVAIIVVQLVPEANVVDDEEIEKEILEDRFFVTQLPWVWKIEKVTVKEVSGGSASDACDPCLTEKLDGQVTRVKEDQASREPAQKNVEVGMGIDSYLFRHGKGGS